MSNDTHKVSWFVYVDGKLIPRTAAMRGTWGYEAQCSCGWATHTGGAVYRYINTEIRFHKEYPDYS